MKFTGERLVLEEKRGDIITLEHLVRYDFASQIVKGKRVLDIACGTGYGSAILSTSGAAKVIGIDISAEAIKYCHKKYGERNSLSFLEGSVANIPLEDNSVDVIISFETVEHVDLRTQRTFAKESKRVLKNDGVLLISTPNPKKSNKNNKYHIRELNIRDIDSLFSNCFKYIDYYSQMNALSSFISKEPNLKNAKQITHRNEIFKIDESDFFVAVISNKKSHLMSPVVISGPLEYNNFLRDYQKLKEQNRKIKEWTAHLNSDIKILNQEIDKLKKGGLFRRRHG